MNKFIKCECYGHLLELEYDREYNQHYLTVWNSGFSRNRLSWFNRICWCWQILKTGNPWNDMFIINADAKKEIVEFLGRDVKDKILLKG